MDTRRGAGYGTAGRLLVDAVLGVQPHAFAAPLWRDRSGPYAAGSRAACTSNGILARRRSAVSTTSAAFAAPSTAAIPPPATTVLDGQSGSRNDADTPPRNGLIRSQLAEGRAQRIAEGSARMLAQSRQRNDGREGRVGRAATPVAHGRGKRYSMRPDGVQVNVPVCSARVFSVPPLSPAEPALRVAQERRHQKMAPQAVQRDAKGRARSAADLAHHAAASLRRPCGARGPAGGHSQPADAMQGRPQCRLDEDLAHAPRLAHCAAEKDLGGRA